MGNTRDAMLTRRDMLKVSAGTVAMASLGVPSAASVVTRRERPNILFIMADQLRGDCIGADGNLAIRTPNLDRIAAEGVRFRCAYSSTPTCTPARTALLTGLSPWHHGMLGMTAVAERYPVEMPQAMRDAGYYTMGIGKMHWTPQRNGHGLHRLLLDEAARADSPEFRSDYQAWFMSEAPNLAYDSTGLDWNGFEAKPYALPEHLHPTHWTGETAVRFLNTYDKPEPFFLKVSFHRPHSPYDPPERFWRQYADVDLPKARVGEWAKRYAPRSDESRHVWHGDLGAEQVRQARQGYYGSVSFVDEEVGRILDALEKRGWLDETLVLFTADHGDMTGDNNLWRKSYAYEPSARVPMLVRPPKGMDSDLRGKVSVAPVELRDVLPTFVEAASASIPDTIDGKSLLGTAAGRIPAREFIDLEHDICYAPQNHWNGLTDGKRKYIFHAYNGEEQFFDLEADPYEQTDLASDPAHTDELRKWRSRLVEHFQERGEPFLKNGDLAPRPESMMTSPLFPKPERKQGDDKKSKGGSY